MGLHQVAADLWCVHYRYLCTTENEALQRTFETESPRNNPKHKKEALPDIHMYAIHALERNPPDGEETVELMLLTNQQVTILPSIQPSIADVIILKGKLGGYLARKSDGPP